MEASLPSLWVRAVRSTSGEAPLAVRPSMPRHPVLGSEGGLLSLRLGLRLGLQVVRLGHRRSPSSLRWRSNQHDAIHARVTQTQQGKPGVCLRCDRRMPGIASRRKHAGFSCRDLASGGVGPRRSVRDEIFAPGSVRLGPLADCSRPSLAALPPMAVSIRGRFQPPTLPGSTCPGRNHGSVRERIGLIRCPRAPQEASGLSDGDHWQSSSRSLPISRPRCTPRSRHSRTTPISPKRGIAQSSSPSGRPSGLERSRSRPGVVRANGLP